MNEELVVFFFFSSRRRHTRCSRDWSSDVCSSDLDDGRDSAGAVHDSGRAPDRGPVDVRHGRSEERRVGKECRSRWATDPLKKKHYTHASLQDLSQKTMSCTSFTPT